MTTQRAARDAVRKAHQWEALLLPLVVLLFPGPLLSLGSPVATPAKTYGWAIGCVDCLGQFPNRTDGTALLEASEWHVETVDSEGQVGEYTSLALDPAGHPHISYYDATNDHLRYAWHDGASWHIETVDSGPLVGEHTSLAVDVLGYPHISYYTRYRHDLKYAHKTSSGWSIETVDSEGDVGLYTSLALAGNGSPHITYYDYTNRDLKYAYYEVPPGFRIYLSICLKHYGGYAPGPTPTVTPTATETRVPTITPTPGGHQYTDYNPCSDRYTYTNYFAHANRHADANGHRYRDTDPAPATPQAWLVRQRDRLVLRCCRQQVDSDWRQGQVSLHVSSLFWDGGIHDKPQHLYHQQSLQL